MVKLIQTAAWGFHLEDPPIDLEFPVDPRVCPWASSSAQARLTWPDSGSTASTSQRRGQVYNAATGISPPKLVE